MTVHVIMVVDKSGSMHHLTDDTIGGFNSYVEDVIKEAKVDIRLTITLFDTVHTILCIDTPIAQAPKLDWINYRPSGNTALLDAIGTTITEFEASTQLANGDKVLFVVQTDGYENSSIEYTKEIIKKMIVDREATEKWGFVFLGADPDTFNVARGMGFNTATATPQTSQATRNRYREMSGATVTMMNSSGPMTQAAEDWMEEIVRDQ